MAKMESIEVRDEQGLIYKLNVIDGQARLEVQYSAIYIPMNIFSLFHNIARSMEYLNAVENLRPATPDQDEGNLPF